MDFQPCDKREKRALYRKDGSRGAVWLCAEQTCEHFQNEVTPEVCDGCPVRQFVLNRSKEARAKPLTIADTNQILQVEKHKPKKPTWLPCISREKVWVASCCGNTEGLIRCGDAESEFVGQEVVPVICQSCPVRKETNA